MYFTQFFSIFLALCWLAPAAMAIDEKDCGPATYAQLNSGRLNLSKTLDAIKSEKDFPYHQAPGNWFHLPAGSKTSAIHYLLQPSGSKKPRGTLVLIGGLNFHSERWNHSGLISELNRQGFDIVSVDIPGHGWTFLHELQQGKKTFWNYLEQPYDHLEQGKLIAALVSHLRAEKVIRTDSISGMGISYGGWLWTSVAKQNPELVDRLLLLSPGAESLHRHNTFLGGIEDNLRLTKSWVPFSGPWLGTMENMLYRPNLEASLRSTVHSHFFDLFPHLKDDPLLADGGTRLFMGIYDFDGISALRELQLPKGIHLFQAEKDEIIPGSLYEKMNSALQSGNGNSTRIIPGAKHDLTEGKPEEIKSLADQIKGIYQK